MQRRLLFVVAVTIATALLTCCTTEQIEESVNLDSQAQSEALSRAGFVANKPVLVSSSEVKTYTGREYLGIVLNDVDFREVGGTLQDRLKQEFIARVSERVNGRIGSRAGGALIGSDEPVALIKYNVCRITYNTEDADGRNVVASARLVWPTRKEGISEVMLCCHGSMSNPDEGPSDKFGLDDVLFTTGAFLVMPDYIGFGATKDRNQNYLCADVTAKNSIHALLAALEYINQSSRVSLNMRYKTYIEGFSQGGQVALASLKYYQEIELKLRNSVHLEKVICGDGPYSLTETFNYYFDNDMLTLPMVGAMAVKGMKDTYGSTAGNYEFESYFSESAKESGLVDAVVNRDEIIPMASIDCSHKVSELYSQNVLNRNGMMFKLLYNALDLNDVTKSWRPRYRLQFFHSTEDTVVPYANYTKAYGSLANKYVEPSVVGEFGDHGKAGVKFYTEMMDGMYK